MGLESVSASEDVIGDLPSPWATINNCGNPGRRGRRRWCTSRVGYYLYLSGYLKKDYGGKRCVFNEERNKGKVGQDRSGRGREFKWMGKQTKKSVGRLPTEYQGL